MYKLNDFFFVVGLNSGVDGVKSTLCYWSEQVFHFFFFFSFFAKLNGMHLNVFIQLLSDCNAWAMSL